MTGKPTIKFRGLLTATLLAIGATTAVQALEIQTYGLEQDMWQSMRDGAYLQKGRAGLVEFDRESARRFYGNAYPSTRELDRQIRIDRRETELDTQERADEVRYGFGRGNGTGVPVMNLPVRFHPGDRLPREYSGRQYVVDDWRGHRLTAPRRGQQWVQAGADYLLVDRAGVIQSVVR